MTTRGSLPAAEDVVQVLDASGSVHEDATVPALDDPSLVSLYEDMRFARHLDDRATTLHRQGRIGTYPPLAGQEAAQIASTMALAADDLISFQYREHGSVVARGMTAAYLCYWMGHEVGNAEIASENFFPLNISIGSQLPHAAGLAMAARYRDDDRAVLCHFGDGATSEGDFHEGLNFAGVFDVPAVFFCNNNQYAISIPRERQTASATIAQKAPAYGFRGIRVDGMDPLAIYSVTKAAIDRAKDPDAPPDETVGSAGRPTLVEAVMYRLGAHTTVDDPDVYRDKAEVERWRQYDPIPRYEQFLRDRGLLDDETVSTIETRIEDTVASLIEEAEAFEAAPARMFEHVYEKVSPRVQRQHRELEQLRDTHGDDELCRDE